jgi:nitrate reductase NapE component
MFQISNVPTAAANVVLMRLYKLAGAKRDRVELASELRRFVLLEYLVVFPVLICGIVPAFGLLVANVIPKYRGCLPLMDPLVYCVFFLPRTVIVRNFWLLEKRLLEIGASNICGLAGLSLGLLLSIYTLGRSLEAVALGTVIGYGIYYLYIMMTIGVEVWGVIGSIGIIMHAGLVIGTFELAGLSSATTPPAEHLPMQLKWLIETVTRNLLFVSPVVLYGIYKTKFLQYVAGLLGRSGPVTSTL